MHPELVKAELRIRFGTVRAFEIAFGLATNSVRDVLRGRSARKTAQAISDSLQIPVTSLFPRRFADVDEDTARKRDAHRLNERAV